MILPQKVVGFLGVMQVLFSTYSILAVNFFLAVKPGANSYLIDAVKNYGILLFLIPLCWTAASAVYVGKPKPSPRAASIAFWSGLAINLLLLAFDIALTIHAVGRSAILKV